MKTEIGGPTKIPATAPDTIDTIGVSSISICVLPATSLPISIATNAATKAPIGSPGLPSA